MLFNPTHSINLANYEEWLLLYADGELQPAQMNAVDAFLQAHPQLLPELEALVATKLPLDETVFLNKEELLAPAMKASVVHEDLLLYIDNELTADQKQVVERRLATDGEYAFQHQLLSQTKADASEQIAYPNKTELYRHTERTILLKPWMRIAAAVLLLLLGSLYFLINEKAIPSAGESVATKAESSKPSPIKQNNQKQPVQTVQQEQQSPVVAARPTPKQSNSVKLSVKEKKASGIVSTPDVALQQPTTERRQLVAIKSQQATIKIEPIAVNKTITPSAVTTALAQPYNLPEATQDIALTNDGFETKKKTPARGFFRKVSRFIERRTGIGTVNADNELVIGAVALKLK